MARRRKTDSIVDDLHELFLHVPAWLCIPVALIAFAGVKIMLTTLAAKNVVFTGLAENGAVFGGMAALLVMVAGSTAALKKWERRKLYNRQTSLQSIRSLSWKEFELLIGEAYRRQGYQVIETGGGGADGGVDLRLKRGSQAIIVQCKQWRVFTVGVKEIRELFGIMVAERADQAIFVTSGVFTQEAARFVDGKPLELIDGETLCRLVAPLRKPGRNINPSTNLQENGAVAPQCPICEAAMVLRTAKRGSRVGSQFWGCPNYPRCRGSRQVCKGGSNPPFD